jgi:hypothetical protein
MICNTYVYICNKLNIILNPKIHTRSIDNEARKKNTRNVKQ